MAFSRVHKAKYIGNNIILLYSRFQIQTMDQFEARGVGLREASLPGPQK